jgi:hypothetical protein
MWFPKRLPEKGSSSGTAVNILDRLQRACAREFIDNARHAPGPHFFPLLKDPAIHDDENQTLANDTHPELSLDQTPFPDTHPELVLREAPLIASAGSPDTAVPSLLRRFRNWFSAPVPVNLDRRGVQRHPFGRVHPNLKILVGSAQWPAMVNDISTTGVSFVLGLQHRRGASLLLTIVDNRRVSTYAVKATVVRLVLLPDGEWLICCAFDEPHDEAWLKVLL